jgi:hypothetical protein
MGGSVLLQNPSPKESGDCGEYVDGGVREAFVLISLIFKASLEAENMRNIKKLNERLEARSGLSRVCHRIMMYNQ